MRLTIPTHLRLLLPAALLAAAAALGGSAVGDPATACAAPMEYDEQKYNKCHEYWHDQFLKDRITLKDYESARNLCCASSGGDWDPVVGICKKPADAETQPTLPNVAPQPGEATQNPAPPPPFRNPGVVPTVTLAPASPG